MAAYARKLVSSGLSCGVSLLISGWRPGGSLRRLKALPALRSLKALPALRSRRSLGATAVLCAVPFLQKPENLTHEDLVRRALSLVTDSANTFLSQTTLAVLDSFSGYIKAVNSLVALHKNYEASISKLDPVEEDVVWKAILTQRQELIERRKVVEHFESCWLSAINLSEQAVAAAFNGGADQASVNAQSSLQLSQSQVELARQLMLEAEKELKVSKAEESERLQVAPSEDEDIPDAYLRED